MKTSNYQPLTKGSGKKILKKIITQRRRGRRELE